MSNLPFSLVASSAQLLRLTFIISRGERAGHPCNYKGRIMPSSSSLLEEQEQKERLLLDGIILPL